MSFLGSIRWDCTVLSSIGVVTVSDLLRYEITTMDHALTRPWTVLKTFRRERSALWSEDQCSENNNHVVVGKEFYFLSGDGYLMPTRKDQPPPDTRYFRTGR